MANSTSGMSSQSPSSRRLLTIAAIVVGIVLLIIAAIYFTQTASSLPSFFPGHVATPTTAMHTKHGIAAAILGVAAFVFAWFNSGPAAAKH